MTVITVSRQFGAGGEMLARTIAENLGFLLVDRRQIAEGLAELGLPPQLANFDERVPKQEHMEKKRRFYVTALHEYLMNLAASHSIVLLGRGGQLLFRDRPDAFHIFVYAPFPQRVEWVKQIYSLEEKAAARLVREQEERKKRYIRRVFGHSWLDMALYDLTLNTAKLTTQGAIATALFALAKFKENLPVKADPVTMHYKQQSLQDIGFMHESEAEFAQVLDFYNIPWQYEPRTFPLQWDTEGHVIEAFTPDFYLPEQNIYVELTTQRQQLVWKKNKKMRRLKELYPEINAKIVYGKDYRNLLKKFGMDEK
ncbi:MAG: cytidylate kinase family protein [Syntrophomonadaceae bacterium]|nr:cytidylate kinase family protein [Syntrophomonadaceae bacterium]